MHVTQGDTAQTVCHVPTVERLVVWDGARKESAMTGRVNATVVHTLLKMDVLVLFVVKVETIINVQQANIRRVPHVLERA